MPWRLHGGAARLPQELLCRLVKDYRIYMICTGALYQWDGRGTPSMFCILEGSANMRAASSMGGRQLTSEPPMQLWGAAAADRAVRP